MTSFGIIEIIAIITTLGGFGVSANPNAPSPAQVMKYAPGDADIMFHVDMEAVVAPNYKALKALPSHPTLKGNTEAVAMVSQIITEIDTVVGAITLATGIDLLHDLRSASLWLKVPSAGDPEVLAVVRGTLPADLLGKIASTAGGSLVEVEGVSLLVAPDGAIAMAMKDGDLLVGKRAWVQARAAKSWQAARPTAGSLAASTSEVLAKKPFCAWISQPSRAAALRIEQEAGANVATDLLAGHERASLALAHDGVSWTWRASNDSGYKRAVMASEGVIQLFRAGQIGGRGMAKLMMASLHSYVAQEPELAAIVKYEAELMALVEQLTGDGNFKVDLKQQPKTRTVSVHAYGNKLSDVVPMIGLLPAAGAFAFFGMRGDTPQDSDNIAAADIAQPATIERASKPVPGLNVRTIYRSAKQAHGL